MNSADVYRPPAEPREGALDPDDPEVIAAQLAFAEVRKVFLFAMGITGVSGLFQFFAGDPTGVAVSVVFAMIMLGLWALSSRQPTWAVVIGLVLLIPIFLGSFFSASIIPVVLWGLILFALMRGLRMASTLRRTQARVRAE